MKRSGPRQDKGKIKWTVLTISNGVHEMKLIWSSGFIITKKYNHNNNNDKNDDEDDDE